MPTYFSSDVFAQFAVDTPISDVIGSLLERDPRVSQRPAHTESRIHTPTRTTTQIVNRLADFTRPLMSLVRHSVHAFRRRYSGQSRIVDASSPRASM